MGDRVYKKFRIWATEDDSGTYWMQCRVTKKPLQSISGKVIRLPSIQACRRWIDDFHAGRYPAIMSPLK